MIPSGVKVFLASHPIDFRKGPDGLLSLVCALCFSRQESRQGQDRLVGWFGRMPLCQAAGEGEVLLAEDRA